MVTDQTGKERDAESGLDYFGARYYGSSMGRFMSPDWSSSPEAVPYANFANPQSLNLYTYAANNPLSSYDLDGHCDTKTQDVVCIIKSIWDWLGSSGQHAQSSGAQAVANFTTSSFITGFRVYNAANSTIQQQRVS